MVQLLHTPIPGSLFVRGLYVFLYLPNHNFLTIHGMCNKRCI
uniref:Uncharacterized protein n=1 Tax=Rhizophora mucronata TaxID=61149 RepID=A0A2P2NEA0_RHIMU